MLLSGALFALFMTGFWLYCLTDAVLTPESECPGMRKRTWVAVIAVTFVCGAIAWLVASRMAGGSARGWRGDRDASFRAWQWTDADDAVARHPAGRARQAEPGRSPKGPDDDLEFLRALDRAIRGNSQAGEA